MPDMIDVILAKSLTPQGQAASAAATAVAAAQDAVEAASAIQETAETAQSTLDALVEQINEIISNVEGGVLYNAVQNLTEAEKAQARDNIGALDVSDFHELLVRHSIGAVTTRALRIDPILGTFNDKVGTLKNADTENGEVEYYARGQEIKLRSGAEYSVTPGYEFRFYTYTPETAEYRPMGLGWLMDWTTSYVAESNVAIRPTFRKINGEPMTNPSEIQLFIKDATLDYINNSIELGSAINITGKLNYGRFLCKTNGTALGNIDRATTRYIPVKQGDSLLINALWGGTKYNDYQWMGLYGYDENYRFVRCLLDMESAYGWVSLNHLEENSVVLDYYLFKVPAGISYIRTSSIYQNKPAAIEPQIFKFLDSAYLDINLRGDQINLGSQNANKVVIVNTDGSLTPSSITEEMLLNGNININPDTPDTPDPTNPSNPITGQTGILGLRIDYDSNTIIPTDDSANSAINFDNYAMYGGRKRCIVNNDGAIIAFYGDNNYSEDATEGYQVMVYQPQFYYKRTPMQISNTTNGQAIRKEIIQISRVAQDGFNLHPLFINEDGEELEYVLLPAYEGSIQSNNNNNDSYKDIQYADFENQKLSSVANAKPISGQNNLLNTLIGQQLASNRGLGWHLYNINAVSAEQMLEIVEFRSLNGQESLDSGICQLSSENSTSIQAAQTGSTFDLGNSTGIASTTTFIYNNNTYTYTSSGQVAISYRGHENPWGNIWQFIGGLCIKNNSYTSHIPYICTNFRYSNDLTEDYISLDFSISHESKWISAFGYNANYDWLFIPIETANTANALTPIGDSQWSITISNGIEACLYGGLWSSQNSAGPFFYAWDRNISESGGRSVNASIMYIPHLSDTYYLSNIEKWNASF